MTKKKQEHTPREVWNLAIDEFYKRLEEDPEKVPPHILGTTLATMARVMEQEKAEEKQEEEASDPLDSLESLPLERQIDLLDKERKRLMERVLDIDRRLGEIHGSEDSQ